MRIPYIKLEQKNEVFFLTKIKASELVDKISFHFREPYSESDEDIESYREYIDKLERKGIDINASEEGVQRRVQINRINSIKKFLENEKDSFFPNSVVLSVDVSNDDVFFSNYDEVEENNYGELTFMDNVRFQIIDGQHRLAGLFVSKAEIMDSFEIPIVLLINTTISNSAKIFADINGNQTKVNKSVIYDLYDLIIPDTAKRELDKKMHSICKQFHTSPKSPLYSVIKMLGIGNGAISQAFFIKYVQTSVKDVGLQSKSTQELYEILFYYFKAFQKIFPDEWPVLNYEEHFQKCDNDIVLYNQKQYSYSRKVLKEEKSQLLKTNGFGALMLLFPVIYRELEDYTLESNYKILSRLKGRFSWKDDYTITMGTGKKVQKAIKDKLERIILETIKTEGVDKIQFNNQSHMNNRST